MEQIASLLAKADALLEQIAVKGNDAFLLVNARSILKTAYDMLTTPKEEEAVDDG